MSEMTLYDSAGNRLYLNADERESFLRVAREKPPLERTLCETLHYTGCRISEALELTAARIDLSGKTIAIRSLKKRKDKNGQQKIIYRTIPVPSEFIDTLNVAHGIREAQKKGKKQTSIPLWDWTRQWGRILITNVMIEAGIPEGPYRCPKGLRHAYGINAVVKGTPLNMLQKWMGHADIKTTAIYANAVGPEEQDIAARLWG